MCSGIPLVQRPERDSAPVARLPRRFPASPLPDTASGFYEWRKQAGGGNSPVRVHRADGNPIAFAGIIGNDGSSEAAAAIITTEPNSLMTPVHQRMPVILEPADWRQWLNDEGHNPDLHALMLPKEWPSLALRNVANAVNRAGNDGPELVADHSVATAPKQERLL